MTRRIGVLAGVVATFGAVATGASPLAPVPDELIWRLGTADNASSEFSGTAAARDLADADPVAPAGLRASVNPALDLLYSLPVVPEHGALFTFKLLQADRSGPQMAVFANGLPAGIVQLWGTAGTTSPWPWRKTYQLYIPPEFLVPGTNVLRLETVRPLWSDTSVDEHVWWEWDMLQLETLAQRPRDPIHGTEDYLGTTLRQSAHAFTVDESTVRLATPALEWLGIAYSGNTIRADFWWDVGGQQPARREYLEALRDLNLTVVADHIGAGHFQNEPDGSMPQRMRDDLDRFFADYGSLIQWYELGNEPCMFGGGAAETLSLGRYVNAIKPEHMVTIAPGWAYGGGAGTPINWARDPLKRRRIEALCQATNGHSYGFSYADNQGGSFVENLETYEGVEDGWPVPYINTETGTNDWHSEENGPRLASTQPHAQAFDRVMRAHLAVADRTMQHAAIFDDFGIFELPNPADPTTLRAFPGVDGQDPRVKTFRRLALAYATHGAPLAYTYESPEQVRGKRVYFRPVDTSALPALPGSRGTSNRVLLSLVSFEPTEQSIAVRVELPLAGAYAGVRYGPGETYTAARSEVTLDADPAVVLLETLAPGESVQYILTPPGPTVPHPPTSVQAGPLPDGAEIRWTESSGAASYTLSRAAGLGEAYAVVAEGLTNPVYIDAGSVRGTECTYVVTAANPAGESAPSDPARAIAGAPRPPEGLVARTGDRQVTLTWQAVDGADAYDVRVADAMAGPFEPLAAGLTTTTFTHGALTNGTMRYYTVAARSGELSGAASLPVGAAPQAPPPAPTGLTAIVGDGRVVLDWDECPGATAFVIGRATAGGPYAQLALGVASTRYTDDAVENAVACRYTVAAENEGVRGPSTAEIVATPQAAPLPDPWRQAGIGEVGVPGTATHTPASGAFTIAGSGGDIWGTADGLHFAYQPIRGDATLTVRVPSFDDTHEWARIGAMVRGSLAPGAAMAIMAVTPGKGCGFTFRAAAGGDCDMVGGAGHRWLRLRREGGALTGWVSDDGKAWEEFGRAEVDLPDDALLGLAVCSHNNGRLNKAIFDQIDLHTDPAD